MSGQQLEAIEREASEAASEIESAVTTVVSNLDAQNDGTVSLKDLEANLLSLDSLLSLDETVDWVVNAVQLPPSVGEVFRANHITGSEFAELLEDDGELLATELGIKKLTWRKKLLKHIRLKVRTGFARARVRERRRAKRALRTSRRTEGERATKRACDKFHGHRR